ncbi:Glutaminyl-peptide cyclotransferase [Lachnellula suecica]|uniref:Peptide hydrolase n=1 Tax=Lachnellula suecica TaxID=602035 RepID=A0A8T9C332_9HELO|nr:Glutaminyl-peptide cyclotransferase [Lachnellula suecica]
MKFCPLLSSSATLLTLHNLFLVTAYTALNDDFLHAIPSAASDFDPTNGSLLAPLLTPRVPGTENHTAAQHHFVNFFSTQLPKWTLEWYNSTSTSDANTPIENLVFKREPPWTVPGQANWLTLAAHYDSKEGSVGASDGAVPCAVLMHVARSIDKYMTQMHDEMDALGEGGTVEMDMAVQIIFLDGKESAGGSKPALYGSRALSETWENATNPVGSKYPNSLSQISMFVLLGFLGSVNPIIPSYFLTTHWVYRNMEALEGRLRKLGLLETQPPFAYFHQTNEIMATTEEPDDHVPFEERGVPFLNILPSPLPKNRDTNEDDGGHLDLPTVKDWAKIMTGLALEWFDMMEVWPE